MVCTNGTCGTTDTTFSGTFGSTAFSGEVDTIQLEVEASSGDSPVAATSDSGTWILLGSVLSGLASSRHRARP